MSDDIRHKVAKVVENAPEWLRLDLASKDPATRTRAEDALSAMIAAALEN